ncbi:hypothetical protein [Arthrobacter sp. CJ23]|uniref:hypothetical protein n=1 Tax=Arthrobacter sp. CJ23 TaxID=2972479 RepID=UPI00215CED91|nr:hypothetical protein [Arthrobacter sp. CJ23]UVJ40197.1 hypothetical protein NVV90_03135 [Arthrobacter sp. CJ23]
MSATAIRSVLSRPRFLVPVLFVAATAAWGISVAAGSALTFDHGIHRLALSAHVLAMVLAFGSVIVVDWVGFLWLIGRRRLHDTSRLESAAAPLIWIGLAGLLLTGAFIHPDITNTATQLKMCCVLGLMLNGISLIPVMRSLHALPDGTMFKDVAANLRARLLLALVLSQSFWWTAIVIGFANSMGRR